MPNIRALNQKKYNISDYRFYELYYFCLQYEDWKEELNIKRNSLKGIGYSDSPSSSLPSNPTEKTAIECEELSRKCGAIERAARIADPELHDYILYAVTHEKITFNYLKMQKNIPCERDRYYDRRRKFYFTLDKILQEGKE